MSASRSSRLGSTSAWLPTSTTIAGATNSCCSTAMQAYGGSTGSTASSSLHSPGRARGPSATTPSSTGRSVEPRSLRQLLHHGEEEVAAEVLPRIAPEDVLEASIEPLIPFRLPETK